MTGQTTTGERPDYDQIIAASLATLALASKPVAVTAPAAATTPAVAAAAPAVDAKSRFKAILGSAAAKDRPKLAQHLALETDLSPEQAEAVLVAVPVEAAQPAGQNQPSASGPRQQSQLYRALQPLFEPLPQLRLDLFTQECHRR